MLDAAGDRGGGGFAEPMGCRSGRSSDFARRGGGGTGENQPWGRRRLGSVDSTGG